MGRRRERREEKGGKRKGKEDPLDLLHQEKFLSYATDDIQ